LNCKQLSISCSLNNAVYLIKIKKFLNLYSNFQLPKSTVNLFWFTVQY